MCGKKILIAHRQTFILSTTRQRPINEITYELLFYIKNSIFLFWHLPMLNQVEFLLYQPIVYLHRKKRNNVICLSCLPFTRTSEAATCGLAVSLFVYPQVQFAKL